MAMWTRRLKIAACVLCFCALMVGVGKGLRYVLLDDILRYERLTFHELYEQDDVDVLLVGSSHCNCSFVPEVLDEALHQNTFNAGTSGQRMDGSCMMIREAARLFDLKHVYLEIFFNMVDYDERENRSAIDMHQVYRISDYLRPSLDKLRFLLKASSPAHYANSFIVARRDAIELFDTDYMQLTVQKKETEQYQKYHYFVKYIDKGYVGSSDVVDGYFEQVSLPYETKRIKVEEIASDWEADLFEAIDLCQKQGIGITLVTAPTPDYLIARYQNYDSFHAYIQKLAAEQKVDFYDFNLCKETHFPCDTEMYYDNNHLNTDGAQRFSRLFARLLGGELSPDELFYPTYADKLSHMPLTVFGVNYDERQLSDGTTVRDCKVVASAPDKLECQITLEKAGGGLSLLQPYSPNTSFQLAADEQGTCVIRYRSIDDPATEYETRLSIP